MTLRKFIFVIFITMVVICTLGNSYIQAAQVSDYYNEVLKFDEDGNLLMTTHDKKATSKITYRTLGWIIKRYDAPLDAPGQKYAVIKMRYADIQYREDPEDSAYIYCYYYGDKQDIYLAVKDANSKWRDILYNYGDYVYIDEVMTVCSNGVPLGTLEGNSSNCIKSTGEVYYDYDGIANARMWASKESLLTHFNKKVKYPSMVTAPEYSINEAKSDSMEYENEAIAIGTIGSNEEDEELFDVTKGIPATEDLYVKVVADSAAYKMKFDRYTGFALFPVKIITTYNFKWVDYYGNNRTEEVKVVRWYVVERRFAYWRVASLSYKYLSGVRVNNYALVNGKYQVSDMEGPEIILEQSAGYDNHIEMPSYTKVLRIDGGTINGKNGLRPTIPEEDYTAEAEECVAEFKVKNDYLKIGTNTIMKKAKTDTTGSNPQNYSCKKKTIYKTGLNIPSTKLNGRLYESTGKVYYTGYKNGTVYSKDVQAIEPVTIHTPVYCVGKMTSDKAYNQQINPVLSINNVVIGKGFSVNVSNQGTHRAIKGYGYQNYNKYVRSNQIKFPIDIYYDGNVYKANTWMNIEGGKNFVVPVGAEEGMYEYTVRSIAVNAPTGGNFSEVTQRGYNIDTEYYVAEYSEKFYVTGRLYGFEIKKEQATDWYTVGKKDKNGNDNNSKNIMLMDAQDSIVDCRVVTVGNYGDKTDGISINVSFYALDNNKRIPVSVFRKDGNKCYLLKNSVNVDYENMVFGGSKELIKVLDNNIANKGLQIWSWQMDFSGHLIVVPQGVYNDCVDYKSIKKQAIQNAGVIVNVDIYAIDSGEKKLSYINTANWKQGLCNMWNKEGFVYGDMYVDGDCMSINASGYQKEDYSVVGTH